MRTRRTPAALLVVGSATAFVVSALALAGFMFRVDVPARLLGGVAFGLLGVWFLFLHRRAKGRAT